MSSTIDYSDRQLVSYALNMWANYIETGDINRNAQEA